MGAPHKGYKGDAGRHLCNTIASELGFHPCDLSDHEFDAIICAVTAIAPTGCRLEGEQLAQRMREIDPFTRETRLGGSDGYVLLERWPVRRLAVFRDRFDTWIKVRMPLKQ
jgi:hypothetical protein